MNAKQRKKYEIETEALKVEIATCNKLSNPLRVATRQNIYNDKVRAYAKKHKITIQKATIALMDIELMDTVLSNVHTYDNNLFLIINKLLDESPIKLHERKFLSDLRKKFRQYKTLTDKQFKWLMALNKNHFNL